MKTVKFGGNYIDLYSAEEVEIIDERNFLELHKIGKNAPEDCYWKSPSSHKFFCCADCDTKNKFCKYFSLSQGKKFDDDRDWKKRKLEELKLNDASKRHGGRE